MPVDENDYNETTNYKLPYPGQDAPIDTAQDFENLAVEVDNQLKATNDEIENTNQNLVDGDKANADALTAHNAQTSSGQNTSGHHVPNNSNVTLGQWALSCDATNTSKWYNISSAYAAKNHTHSYMPISGGRFSNTTYWDGHPYYGPYNQTGNTNWSNPYLLTVMTAIQNFQPLSGKEVKDDIKPLSTEANSKRFGQLDEVVTEAFDHIQPVSFTYTNDERLAESERGRPRYGFIAEEVHKAGVATDEWTFLIDTGEKNEDGSPIMEDSKPLRLLKEVDLTAVLWAKVQELETRLKELEP